MANLNKYLCMGRMTKDSETTFTQSGVAVCKFSLATNEKYKDEEKTEFTNFVAFGKIGETIAKYCSKGSELYIEARKETQKYQDANGQTKWSTSFIVNNFQFIGSKSDNQQQQNYQAPQQGYQTQQQQNFQNGQSNMGNPGGGGFDAQNQQQGDGIPF